MPIDSKITNKNYQSYINFLFKFAGIASYEEVENGNTTEIVKHKLMSAYVENIYPILAEKFKEQDNQNIHKESNIANFELTWCTSWWTQFHVLLKRDIKERKHQAFTIFTTFQVIYFHLITLQKNKRPGRQNMQKN